MSGAIANSIADLTLLYAVMANQDYPKPTTNGINGFLHGAKDSAPAGFKPLGLPRTLLPLTDADGDGQYLINGSQPLKGLRIGVYREVG